MGTLLWSHCVVILRAYSHSLSTNGETKDMLKHIDNLAAIFGLSLPVAIFHGGYIPY